MEVVIDGARAAWLRHNKTHAANVRVPICHCTRDTRATHQVRPEGGTLAALTTGVEARRKLGCGSPSHVRLGTPKVGLRNPNHERRICALGRRKLDCSMARHATDVLYRFQP